MVVIGLTGSIAAGKSFVAARLAEHGAEVLDCDRLVKELTAPGSPGLAAVAARFGPELVAPDGRLERARLARRVFDDPQALAELESILHPMVEEQVRQRLAAGTAAAAVVEAIKLLESGLDRLCDEVWVVTAPAELRARRLVAERGMAPADAAQRLAAQGDDTAKRAVADRVFTNDGAAAELFAVVDQAWQELFDPARGAR